MLIGLKDEGCVFHIINKGNDSDELLFATV